MMQIRREIVPFLVADVLAGGALVLLLVVAGGVSGVTALVAAMVPGGVLAGYFCWFFRDPLRTPPGDADAILAAADGVVARISTFTPEQFGSIHMLAGLQAQDMAGFRNGDVLRVSIFLSLFDVHVNRFPIGGEARFLGYFPGRHFFTFQEKSSDVNQHNSILIVNPRTCCLVNQIVGPVCRRVVYWLDHEKPVAVSAGSKLGMMKFGSRLDLYFPASDVDLQVAEGQRVAAGISILGRIRKHD